MSDKHGPLHLRDINNPPRHLTDEQKKKWIRTAIKAKKNFDLEQNKPSFVVPSSAYEVFFINKYTTIETFQSVIIHVEACYEFTLDTESEKSDHQLALIQIQSIPRQLPCFIVLVELAHLPSEDSVGRKNVQEFFRLIFRRENTLNSWGSLDQELRPAASHGLYEWPIRASMRNIQDKFPAWYNWALSHCEICCPSLRRTDATENDMDTNVTIRPTCTCHEPSPYRPGEKWALQKAIHYVYDLFLDKSTTLNHWSTCLDPIYSTLPQRTRENMVYYAATDCLATTCFIRPVLDQWSFRRTTNTDIIELFQATSQTAKRISPNLVEQSINQQVFKRVVEADLGLTSDEDDEEVELIQCVENVAGDQQQSPQIKTEPTPPVPKKQSSAHQHRSKEARRRRNQKRNLTHRSRRYERFFVRQVYPRFTMKMIRRTLERYHVHYTHVKIAKDSLVIGVKNEDGERSADRKLPEDAFDRLHYYRYYHRRRWSTSPQNSTTGTQRIRKTIFPRFIVTRSLLVFLWLSMNLHPYLHLLLFATVSSIFSCDLRWFFLDGETFLFLSDTHPLFVLVMFLWSFSCQDLTPSSFLVCWPSDLKRRIPWRKKVFFKTFFLSG